MRIVSVKIPEYYIEAMDELISRGRYASRSEIIRAALREFFKRELWSPSRVHEPRRRDPRVKVVEL